MFGADSIEKRLLRSATLVLTTFVILTAVAISYAVHQRAERAVQDRLQGLVYGILGATDVSDDGTLRVRNAELPEPRLTRATTGIHGAIQGDDGALLWQSRSTVLNRPDIRPTPVGEWHNTRLRIGDEILQVLQLSIRWQLDDGREVPFTVQVASNSDDLYGQLRRFDRTLWLSLAGMAVALLLVQTWVLRRSLRPLQTIGDELDRIESGGIDALSVDVPSELRPLATSLNALLASERHRHAQYRHLVDDLAHSLKTPLSVLNNAIEARGEDPSADTALMSAQIQRIRTSIDRYVQRASAESGRYLAAPLAAREPALRVCQSVSKLYADQGLDCEIDIDASFSVKMAESDLYEVLGNIVENAGKYGAERIRIYSESSPPTLIIEDDGPGFPEAMLPKLGQRGLRADTRREGQGFGLAAARQLMENYAGSLSLSRSPTLGGARVALHFRA